MPNATPAFTHDTFALIFIVGGFVDKGLLSSGDVGSVTITSRLPFIYEQLLAFEQIDFVVPKHFFDHAKFEVFNPLVEHVFVYKAFSLPLVERVADVRAPPIHRVTARATHVDTLASSCIDELIHVAERHLGTSTASYD